MTLTVPEQIEQTKKNIKLGSEVKVWRDGKVIHWGKVIGLSNSFARVFRPRRNNDDTSGDVDMGAAEWFALACNMGFISLND